MSLLDQEIQVMVLRSGTAATFWDPSDGSWFWNSSDGAFCSKTPPRGFWNGPGHQDCRTESNSSLSVLEQQRSGRMFQQRRNQSVVHEAWKNYDK